MAQPCPGQLTAEPLLKISVSPQRGRVWGLDERDGKPNLAHVLNPFRAAVGISRVNVLRMRCDGRLLHHGESLRALAIHLSTSAKSRRADRSNTRSEEHTSELQSL